MRNSGGSGKGYRQSYQGKGAAYDGGYEYGYEDWGAQSDDYRPPESYQVPQVADKLSKLRENLNPDAMKVYHALQLALKIHSTPGGSRPNFDKDFHDNLVALFPKAYNIDAHQIGSWNQWEVKIDGGVSIFCSVRMEVLGEDPEFVQSVKHKARIVKDTLLENNARWKRNLQPDGGALSYEKLQEFRHECAQRVREYDRNGGCGGKGDGMQGGNRWNDRRSGYMHSGGGQDEMSQVLGERVVASFACQGCQNTWTSHHVRLRQDKTISGQLCSRCGARGESTRWWKPEGEQERSDLGRRQQGMHRANLCETCLEFGNCMGVFYDPFILTTALSLLLGKYVNWRPFSDQMPELLIADTGSMREDYQVTLQPHVYIDPRQQAGPSQPWARSEQVRGNARDEPFGGYPSDQPGVAPQRGRNAARAPPPATWRPVGQSSQPAPGQGSAAPETAPARREAGGVKNEALFDGFLKHFESAAAPREEVPVGRAIADGDVGTPAPSSFSWAAPGTSAPGDEAGGVPEVLRGGFLSGAGLPPAFPPDPVPALPPPEPTITKTKKANKIHTVAQEDKQVAPPPPTPLLDALPQLRKTQFLQIVLRELKANGRPDTEKHALAESYLATCGGDYDQAYRHVKSLTPPS